MQNFKNNITKVIDKPYLLIIFPLNIIFTNLKKISFISKLLVFLHHNFNIFVEYKNFQKSARSNKTMLFVWDCLVCPPTYGDFFYYLMVSRIFKKKLKKIKIIVIKGQYRNGWERLKNKKGINNHLMEIKKLAIHLLEGSNKNFEFINWDNFKKKYLSNEEQFYFPFRNKILKRKPTYPFSYNYLNFLIKKEKNNFINSWLLKSKKFISKKKINIYKKKYITLVARHSTKSFGQSSDLSKKNFILIVQTLIKNFPKYNILVISNVYGCKYFKEIAKKKKFKCYFSKDISSSFIEDGNLILNSKAKFQYFSGGIGGFAQFSKVPYIECAAEGPASSTSRIGKYKHFIWQKKNQLHYFGDDIYFFINLIKNFKIAN